MAAACVGLALSNWAAVGAAPACAVLVACAGGIAAARAPATRLVLLGVALAAAGGWWGSLRLEALAESPLSARLGEGGPAMVVVTGPARRSRFAVRVPAEVRRFDGHPLRERVLLQLPPERAPPQGAVLALAHARPVAPRGPETGFDERAWLERRGTHVVLEARRWRVVGRRGGIGGVADRLREHIASTTALGASGERRALLDGVVLGADEGVPESLRDAFRASGLYHLMAVSGQNVAILALGVLGLAFVLGVPRAAGHLAAIAVVLAYALAVGWQPSVVRAAVAGCVASLAWLASRPAERWHLLALGALLLLAWTPRSLLEPGFQLSFAAVAAIFVAVPRLRRLLEGYPGGAAIATLTAVSLACAAATAPITWLHFGRVPLWTVLANALAEPVMPPLLSLALAAAAVEPVLPGAAAALAWLAGLCAAWLALVARAVGSLPLAEVSSPVVPAAFVLVTAAALGLPVLGARARRTLPAAVLVAALVGAAAWWALGAAAPYRPPDGLRVTFLDVGQGDAALIETPAGAVLVDQGPPEAELARALRRRGLRSLAAVVLTHPQRDHVGGAADVIRRLRVGTVLAPGLAVTGADEQAALRAARARGVRVEVARAGAAYRLERLALRVLWPDGPGTRADDPNARAIVLLASYGATDVLFTADAESDVTRRLPLRPVEVLKVAHHGSEDAGLAGQLRVLRPRVAVISVGAENDYGHPRAETLAALEASPGLTVARTDLDGSVTVESDGRSLSWSTSR